jgi:AcrR family transcriptional regulator
MIAPASNDRDTRSEILHVASHLFSARGFANVSIREICDMAGVSAPTIYHHFGDKERLFQEVIRKTLSLREFYASLVTAVEAHNDAESRLRSFIYHYLREFPRDFFNPGMFLQHSTQISKTSFELVAGEVKAIDDLAQSILQDGILQGIFRQVDLIQARGYLMKVLMSYVLGEVHYRQP